MKSSIFIFCCALFFISCDSSKSKSHDALPASQKTSHFSVKDSAGFTIIEIVEPFLNSSKVERYVLYSKAKGKPEGLNADVFVGLPIERVGINSTTHLGYLNAIGEQDKVVAVSNSSLFYDSAFQKRIREGKVKEIGTRALNTELVIESELDVLFTFAIDAGSYEGIQQLRKLGQPAIVISEYMESDPVDKAKWLKVFAAFFDKSSQEMAQQHLNAVQRRYDSIKLQSSLNSQLPAVAIGLPWKGTWYVSGGNSYQAQLIKDAGANYCWNNYKQVASVPLDIETAISKGMQANFWINPGSITNANNLSESNTVFQTFSAFKNEKIYTNYKRSNQLGANDYWEMGVVRPDLILSDLVSIFHHEGKDSLTFYQSVFE